MLGEHVSMAEALLVTAVSMLIVFATLYILSLILQSFKFIFKEEAPKVQSTKAVNTVKQEQVNTSNAVTIDKLETEEEIVAAIAASIAASDEKKNSRIHIKSIKLLG